MEWLPLFPLQLVVFPGERLKLHIFEPRYRQLIADCEADADPFGIPAYIDGKVAEYGTAVTLERIITRYEDGELDIESCGLYPFRIIEYTRTMPNKLYAGAKVEFLDVAVDPRTPVPDELIALYRRFHEIIETEDARDCFDETNLSYLLAHEIGMPLEDKVKLLAIPEEPRRIKRILKHLRRAVPLLEAAAQSRKRVMGNGRVHTPDLLEL